MSGGQFSVVVEQDREKNAAQACKVSAIATRMPISAPFERRSNGTRDNAVNASFGSTLIVVPRTSLLVSGPGVEVKTPSP